MDDGYLTVPTGDGIGVTPDSDFLDSVTISKEVIV
jgi:O-succinylbenzoate synthase